MTDNIQEIIRRLEAERAGIDQALRSLKSAYLPLKGRRGRKSMDAQERKQVSERMRKYWAGRRMKARGGA